MGFIFLEITYGRFFFLGGGVTPPETNMEPLKMDPWNFGDSYWKPSFSGFHLSFRGGDRFLVGFRAFTRSVGWD